MNKHNNNQFYEKAYRLYQHINNPDWMNQLLKESYNIFKNPVILCDYAHKLLAEYHESPVSNSQWSEFATQKDYCLDWIDDDFHKNVQDLLRKKIIFYQLEDNVQTVVGAIFRNETCYGFLGILLENQLFTEDDKALFLILLDVLGICMSNEELLSFTNNYYGAILQDILDKKIHDKNTLLKQMRARNWTPKKFYRCIYIKSEKIAHMPPVPYILRDICALSVQIMAIEYKDNIFVVVESNSEKYLDVLSEYVYGKIEELHLSAGVSSIFFDLFELQAFYEDAVQTLFLGSKLSNDRNLYFFEDYQLIKFLGDIKMQTAWKRCAHTGVIQLEKYDKENGSSLSATMYTYLKCGRSSTKCSQELGLHKNTVTGHLEKIKRILHTDFSNNDDLFHMLLTFELLDYSI